jgi:hypothetical protein
VSMSGATGTGSVPLAAGTFTYRPSTRRSATSPRHRGGGRSRRSAAGASSS